MSDDWKDALRGLMPEGEAVVPEPEAAASAAGPRPCRLAIALERKGRGGKTATIIHGFADDWADHDIDNLARDLKRTLGTGGSARGGEILVQGDRVDDVRRWLIAKGFKIK